MVAVGFVKASQVGESRRSLVKVPYLGEELPKTTVREW